MTSQKLDINLIQVTPYDPVIEEKYSSLDYTNELNNSLKNTFYSVTGDLNKKIEKLIEEYKDKTFKLHKILMGREEELLSRISGLEMLITTNTQVYKSHKFHWPKEAKKYKKELEKNRLELDKLYSKLEFIKELKDIFSELE